MVFVRLQGCDVGCYFCDTKYTWKQDLSKGVEMLELVEKIVSLARQNNTKWVCITGGEPLEQDVIPLFQILIYGGFKIHVETSGFVPVKETFISLLRYDRVKQYIKDGDLHITISPKDLYTKHKEKRKVPIDKSWRELMSEIKVVVSSKEEIDYFVDNYMDWCSPKRPLVFQFIDNKPTKELIDYIMTKDNNVVRVMLQQHKVMGLE